MDRSAIAKKVWEICDDQFLGSDLSERIEDVNFEDTLDGDSFDLVELCMSVEEAFDLEIPDEEVEKWKTVRDVIDYVNGQPVGAKVRK